MDKKQFCSEFKILGVVLAGNTMKIFVGIDMLNDKFDHCEMDDPLKLLCRVTNSENCNDRFRKLSYVIKTLKSSITAMKMKWNHKKYSTFFNTTTLKQIDSL